MYIYTYTHIYISRSLSLYIYIYIYNVHTYTRCNTHRVNSEVRPRRATRGNETGKGNSPRRGEAGEWSILRSRTMEGRGYGREGAFDYESLMEGTDRVVSFYDGPKADNRN